MSTTPTGVRNGNGNGKVAEWLKTISLLVGLVIVIAGSVGSWFKMQMDFNAQFARIGLENEKRFADEEGRIALLEWRVTNELKRINDRFDQVKMYGGMPVDTDPLPMPMDVKKKLVTKGGAGGITPWLIP
jgi:hypothetical protein